MKDTSDCPRLRLAILQRVCAPYRVSLFRQLAKRQDLETVLFIGDDLPKSKVKSSNDPTGFKIVKLKTVFLKIGARIFPWHVGLVRALRSFRPDVILCEGESHFLGYVAAIFYRCFFNRRVALIHWCYISLPGEPNKGKGVRPLIKKFFRRFFDAFLVYSTYSKRRLIELGMPSDRIFVATNVGDTARFLAMSENMTESRSAARKRLGLPERFTVLYSGTIDRDKQPELLLELARRLNSAAFNFVLIGSGPLLDVLRLKKDKENLLNVFLPGRVVEDLPLYYRAADVLLIPGLGGIVISEAMAFGLPVILHQADGTEFDLIESGLTGFIVKDADVSDFEKAVQYLFDNKALSSQIGINGKNLIKTRCSTDNMANQIVSASKYARIARKRKFCICNGEGHSDLVATTEASAELPKRRLNQNRNLGR